MAKTLYEINLSEEERTLLRTIIEQEPSERAVLRARILLYSDTSNTTKYTVTSLAEELKTTRTTIQTTRTEYANGGVEAAVFRKKREVAPGGYKHDEDMMAQIAELYAGPPPEGKKKWSIRLLCKACEEKGIVDHMAPSTMDALLKRMK